MSKPTTVACTRDFSHLFVRLEKDETCPHCYILELEADNAALKRSITDGRLTHIHFRAWANSIANEKGYSGSEIETLCLRLADALLTAEESE